MDLTLMKNLECICKALLLSSIQVHRYCPYEDLNMQSKIGRLCFYKFVYLIQNNLNVEKFLVPFIHCQPREKLSFLLYTIGSFIQIQSSDIINGLTAMKLFFPVHKITKELVTKILFNYVRGETERLFNIDYDTITPFVSFFKTSISYEEFLTSILWQKEFTINKPEKMKIYNEEHHLLIIFEALCKVSKYRPLIEKTQQLFEELSYQYITSFPVMIKWIRKRENNFETFQIKWLNFDKTYSRARHEPLFT